MSLNFYGYIDNIAIDSKGELAIKIKTPASVLGKSLSALNDLKRQATVSILLESAELEFKESEEIETGKSRYSYGIDKDGKWQRTELEQTALDIDGQPNYQDKKAVISAKDVDDFLISQSYDYDQLDVKSILVKISEGYEFDDIAKGIKMTTIAMLNELNKAREEFAPYAAAWISTNEDKDGDDNL